jgi:hypothetical protein
MRQKIIGISVFILLIFASTVAAAAAGIPISEVRRFLLLEMGFSPAGSMRMWNAIYRAITDNRLQTGEALSFLVLLNRAHGLTAIKEAIGLAVAATLDDELPVTLLINRTSEGLARGIRLQLILKATTQQRAILSGVRDLLVERGIFIIGAEEREIPLPHGQFNLVVMHMADALHIYLAGREDPRHIVGLHTVATKRLVRLSEIGIIPAATVSLVLRLIDNDALSKMVIDATRD